MVLFRLNVVNPVSNLVDIFYMCFNGLLRPAHVLDADVSMGITAVLKWMPTWKPGPSYIAEGGLRAIEMKNDGSTIPLV